jgi:hypothetical protein
MLRLCRTSKVFQRAPAPGRNSKTYGRVLCSRFCKPLGVFLKLRWKLKEYGTSLRFQKADPAFQKSEAVAGCRAEPLPVRDKLGGLPGENEFWGRLLSPSAHRLGCRCPIEDPIEFRRWKVLGIVVELKPFRKLRRKERAAPGLIAPTRGSYENHRLRLLGDLIGSSCH